MSVIPCNNSDSRLHCVVIIGIAYLRSSAPEGSAGLGMLPGLAQSWITAVLCTHGQPRDWKRRRGRLAHTWTRTVEADLRPANIGLFSAWRRAQDRTAWSG